MKKLLLLTALIGGAPCFSAVPYSMTNNIELGQKDKQFTTQMASKDLSESTTQEELQNLLEEFVAYVVKEKDNSEFQSVRFNVVLNENKKQLTIKDIEFFDDNSFAVGIAKIFDDQKNSTTTLECDGISIDAQNQQDDQDSKQITTLTDDLLKIMQSSSYKSNQKIASTIDINYQTIQ